MEMGMIPGGAYRNRDAYRRRVQFSDSEKAAAEMLLYDPQTSGGLLAAIPAETAGAFERDLARRGVHAACIGQFDGSGLIRVT
jgi:selenide,water dikinase